MRRTFTSRSEKRLTKSRFPKTLSDTRFNSWLTGLQLQSNDRLLELCCGNGLMTRYLAALVEHVYAVDFVEHLISHACRFRAAPNVHYVCADAVDFVNQLLTSKLYVPSKVLLGDALGYFEPSSLGGTYFNRRTDFGQFYLYGYRDPK